MTRRLVLATAPVSLAERYGAFAGAASTQPSFGLVCLAAAARAAGADVRLVEAAAENLPMRDTIEEILRFDPHVLGLSATTAGIAAAGALAAAIKRRPSPPLIVIGGCHASALPARTLAEFEAFDLAAIGEGETTLVDILARAEASPDLPRGVPGTAERNGGEIRINPPRPVIENLDRLPLPAWDLLRGFPRAFRPSPARIRRWPCASVVLTRGCPNQCTFCDRSVFGNRSRAYSPARAVDLLEDLRRRYGVKEVLIEDDTFMVSKTRVEQVCDEMLRRALDLSWSCLGRADRVDPDLLKRMKKAGCWHISFGIESGDPEILRAVKKNLDIEQIRAALAWSRQAGLRTKGFFIVGLPGETRATLEATRRLACSLPLDDLTVMHLTPFPGSELYATAERHGAFDRDWRRMSALEAVFVPRGLTAADLRRARADMLRSFYARASVLFRRLAEIARHPRLVRHMAPALGALLRGLSARDTRHARPPA